VSAPSKSKSSRSNDITSLSEFDVGVIFEKQAAFGRVLKLRFGQKHGINASPFAQDPPVFRGAGKFFKINPHLRQR
jgi:hypothetical protein